MALVRKCSDTRVLYQGAIKALSTIFFFYMPDGGAEGFELVCESCDACVLRFDRLFVLRHRLHKGSVKALLKLY